MKFTVIAGTHQRENEFSHSLADNLIGRLDLKKTDEFSDEYNTRRAEVYDSDEIAIAKIHPIRELPKEYFETEDNRALDEYMRRKFSIILGKTAPALNAEGYQLKTEWTGVHENILNVTNPKFYIDIHSYHKRTKDINRSTLVIGMFADDEIKIHFEEKMKKAEKESPQAYKIIRGISLDRYMDNMPKVSEYAEDCEIDRGIIENTWPIIYTEIKALGKDKIINFLSEEKTENMSLPKETIALLKKYENQYSILDEKWDHNGRLSALEYPEVWFLESYEKSGKHNKIHFEAVHWGEKNKKLIADFITDYLI